MADPLWAFFCVVVGIVMYVLGYLDAKKGRSKR